VPLGKVEQSIKTSTLEVEQKRTLRLPKTFFGEDIIH